MLRFGVIGVGRMGTVHAANLYFGMVRGARLCAVCDTDPQALAKAKKRFPRAQAFHDVESMLAAGCIDAAVVATPHYAHPSVAVSCLDAGVHVLVEKPLAVTEKDAQLILAAAQRNPQKVAAVMLNQRTNPLYRRAKKLVESGKIGEIQRAEFVVTDWYRSQAYYNQGGWRASLEGEGGGTLINQCVHQLDIMQWVLGMPVAVESRMYTKGRDIFTENDVVALFEYAGGVNCVFTASTHELHGVNRFEIAGTKGRIDVEGLRMTVKLFAEDEREVNARTTSGYGKTACRTSFRGYRAGFALCMLSGGQQCKIIRNFAAAISGRESLVSPVADGLGSVRLINAVYESGWTAQRVAIPVDSDAYARMLAKKTEEEKLCLNSAANGKQDN